MNKTTVVDIKEMTMIKENRRKRKPEEEVIVMITEKAGHKYIESNNLL